MATDFVRTGKRIDESRAALKHLGVPLGNQIYLELPDGDLGSVPQSLGQLLDESVQTVQPDRFFTTGARGYDGHPDHIAVHRAGLHAVRRLGGDVVMWALSHANSGELRIGGDRQHKIGAMTLHVSQVQTLDFERWGGTDLYTPLITGEETYNRILTNTQTLLQ